MTYIVKSKFNEVEKAKKQQAKICIFHLSLKHLWSLIYFVIYWLKNKIFQANNPSNHFVISTPINIPFLLNFFEHSPLLPIQINKLTRATKGDNE